MRARFLFSVPCQMPASSSACSPFTKLKFAAVFGATRTTGGGFAAMKSSRRCFSSKDFYKILGVEATASDGDIKKAYFNKAQQLHPDKPGGCANRFKEVSDAYETLSKSRKEYDRNRQTSSHSHRTTSSSSWQSHSSSSWQSHSSTSGFKDPWEEYFGGGAGSHPGGWEGFWQEAEEAAHQDAKRSSRAKRGARHQRSWMEDSDDEEFGFQQRPKGRGKGKGKTSSKRSTKSEFPNAVPFLRFVAGKFDPPMARMCAGDFTLFESFNGRPVYRRTGGNKKEELFVFYSTMFNDWKIHDDIVDDGACRAYCTDGHADSPFLTRRAWSVWDFKKKSFVKSQSSFQSNEKGEDDGSEKSKGAKEGAESKPKHEQPGKPLSKWTVSELQKWLNDRNVPTDDCFERVDLLERVKVYMPYCFSSFFIMFPFFFVKKRPRIFNTSFGKLAELISPGPGSSSMAVCGRISGAWNSLC